MVVRRFCEEDRIAVVELWMCCGFIAPQNDPNKDIDRKLSFQPDLFLVGEEDGRVVASVMAGYEGHRGVINYLSIYPSEQKKGLGREMMEVAVKLLRAQGCPKVNLNVRKSNLQVIDFYEGLGFSVDEVVSLGLRLEHDT